MEPFIGQVLMFGGNFAPRGWAFCQGQLIAVSQNEALFSILGTTYGGDGRTTFGLPDLRGRVAIGQGNGPGINAVSLGERTGAENVTLNAVELPSHSHEGSIPASSDTATTNLATNNVLGNATIYTANANKVADMPATSSSMVGENRSHTNMQPYIAVNYIIALYGTYPSRS